MSKLTEKALIDSFFKLLKKTPLKKIKVSDITAECGVNRMTFYYHFENISHLIEKAFESRFFDSSKSEITPDNWRTAYLDMHLAVYESRELVRKVYPEFELRELIKFLGPVARKFVRAAVNDKIVHLSSEKQEKILQFFQSNIVGGFLYWLETDLAQRPRDIVETVAESFYAVLPSLISKYDNT